MFSRISCLLLLQLITFPHQAFSQYNPVITSAPFLLINPDSRAGGLGQSGCASEADAASAHWNPAKCSFSERENNFSFDYTPWLRALMPDINYVGIFASCRTDSNSTIAGAMKYIAYGDQSIYTPPGLIIGQFQPSEFSFGLNYSRKMTSNFSMAMGAAYIMSSDQQVPGNTWIRFIPAEGLAFNLAFYYKGGSFGKRNRIVPAVGSYISNIGRNKRNVTEAEYKYFPINLRIGGSLSFKLNEKNVLNAQTDLEKLLTPTTPEYLIDANGNYVLNSTGQKIVVKGKDPGRGPYDAVLGSFSDAPGGAKEELHEIGLGAGLEYIHDKLFAFRAGFRYQHPDKGPNTFFTFGAGIRYSVFGLDMSYLLPLTIRNPLQNTLSFSLLFSLNWKKQQLPIRKEEIDYIRLAPM